MNHEWAEFYDVVEANVFEVQDEVVSKIVGTLVGRINEASVHHARLRPPASLAAYELVLRANALSWESRDAKAEARRLLEDALKLDAEYALAHALLAAVGLRDASYHARLTPDVLKGVSAHARRAVDAEPNDSACHSILGWVLVAMQETVLAEEHLRRALVLNPSNPFAMVNMGSLLVQLGRPGEALTWFARARETDPYFNPSWVQEKLGLAHFTARRYAESDSHFRRALHLRFYMRALHAGVLTANGNVEGAKRALQMAFEQRPDISISMIQELLPFSSLQDSEHLARILSAAGLS